MCVVVDCFAQKLTGSDPNEMTWLGAPFRALLKMDFGAQSFLVRKNFKQKLASRMSNYTLKGILNQDHSKGEQCALLYTHKCTPPGRRGGERFVRYLPIILQRER